MKDCFENLATTFAEKIIAAIPNQRQNDELNRIHSYLKAHREHREVFMNYLVNPDISEEIDAPETDPLTGTIIGAAIDVHRVLGPGLLESAYEACLAYEIKTVKGRNPKASTYFL